MTKQLENGWPRVLNWSILTVYGYFFFEWLFFATKPSFLSALNSVQKLRVLLNAPLPFVLATLLFIAVIYLLASLVRHPNAGIALLMATLPALAATTATLFLLIDNFSYVVFGLGIQTAQERAISLYYWGAPLLVLVSLYLLWRAGRGAPASVRNKPILIRATLGLVTLSLLSVLAEWATPAVGVPVTGSIEGDRSWPDVILLSSDGISARRMSAYGSERDTTPFLREHAGEFLIAENAFPNGGPTTGSVTSRLTGKLPTRTRVIYPPDILRGQDVYQHFPALLKRLGYTSVDLSIRHYADAFDLNMRNAFDSANFRDLAREAGYAVVSSYLGMDAAVFLERTASRLFSRLDKIYRGVPMDDAFEEVQESDSATRRDSARMARLYEFFEEQSGPRFAHVHLMGTHGPKYRTRERVFSVGQEQNESWMPDFYDDAILDFDRYVSEVYAWLQTTGRLESTILVISTDHGLYFGLTARIPLMIRFPDKEHAGAVIPNAQNLDIAPTLLDYLNQPIPSWMQGLSLIGNPLPPLRPVFGVHRAAEVFVGDDGWQIDFKQVGPPFFSLGQVSVTYCQQGYRLRLAERTLRLEPVAQHTAPCASVPSPKEAIDAIRAHLRENGYDISGIEGAIAEVQWHPDG